MKILILSVSIFLVISYCSIEQIATTTVIPKSLVTETTTASTTTTTTTTTTNQYKTYIKFIQISLPSGSGMQVEYTNQTGLYYTPYRFAAYRGSDQAYLYFSDIIPGQYNSNNSFEMIGFNKAGSTYVSINGDGYLSKTITEINTNSKRIYGTYSGKVCNSIPVCYLISNGTFNVVYE